MRFSRRAEIRGDDAERSCPLLFQLEYPEPNLSLHCRRLFRGTRVNVLRARADAAEYGVEQLLAGVLLFTPLLLLLPTIFMFR